MKRIKNLLISLAILAAFGARASADLTISTQTISGATIYITQEMNWGGYKPAITRDTSGNVYVVNSFNTGSGDSDIVIRKFDSSFNPLWMQISSSPAYGYDYGRGIAVDASGNNVYVAGSHDRGDLGQGQDIWIAKYNAINGNFVSSRTYNGTPNYSDEAYDIALDGSGNVYVVGSMHFDYSGYANSDIWLSKFDSNLNQVWVTTYNSVSNNYDYGYALDVKDNYVYITGSINDMYYGNEIWFAKYKTLDGTKVWDKTYSNGVYYGYDYGYDIKVDGIGNIYVAGSESRSDLSQGDNIWLGKSDAYGNMMWSKSYNGPSNGWDYGYGLFIDNMDNVYLAGKVETYDQGPNFRLYKYAPNGSLLYLKDLNSTEYTYSYDTAYDVFASSTGYVYVAGAFNDKFGICTYQETGGGQTGTAVLTAGQGSYTASVNLSWSYSTGLPSNSTYYIQYTTSANTAWNIGGAQIVVATGPVSIGIVQNHIVGGLEASRDGYGNLTSPNYYFKVWISSPGNVGALPGPATSYAKTPNFYTQTSVYADGKMFLVNDVGITVKSAFARDSSGNNYVALGSLPTGTGDSGWTLYKYDSSGSIIWTKFYNSSVNANYNIYGIKTDNAGNIYLAGSQSAGTFAKIWSCKLNSDGKVLWEKIFNNPENAQDEGRGVAVDASGNVYVAGYFWGGAGIGFNIWLGKYNSGGMLLGATNYTSPIIGSDYAYDVKADTSGYVYVAGSEAATITNRNALIIKYDASVSTPTLVGKITYDSGSDNTDEFNGLTLDNSGNVYAAGYEYRMDLTQGFNALLAKYDSNLTVLLSTRTYNSSANNNEEGYSVAADASGNIYVAGYETRSDLFQYKNFWVRKYDSSGNVKWTKTHNGSASLDDYATFGIYSDNAGNVYAGIMENTSLGFYKFSQPSFAITAGPGKPGTVNVSWISEAELATGTTFYVQHSTYTSGVSWNPSNAQDVFISAQNFPSGAKLEYFIGGLDAGRDSAGNNNSPAYYFKVWSDISGTAVEVTGTATGYANVPFVTDSSYIYPNAKLFAINNVYGWRNPIARDSSGNIYVAGNTWIAGETSTDTYTTGVSGSNVGIIRKYNSQGAVVWTKFYSDGKNYSYPEIQGLATDNSGNLYAIGTHGTWESPTKQDIFVLKYNSAGRLLWKKPYDYAQGYDYGRGIALDNSGNIYITGSVDVGGYNQDLFVAKLNSSGVVQTSVTVNGAASSSDEGYAIAVDTSSNMLYVVGKLDEGGTDSSNLWIGKADLNLNPILTGWPQEINGDAGYSWDTGYSVAIDASGNVYAAGTLNTMNEGANIYLVKYSSDGVKLWDSQYNSSSQNYDEGYGVALDGLGGVYISGKESRWDINQGDNIFIRKYNTSGDVLWTHTFNSAGSNYDAGFGVVADNYGFVYVAANTGNGTGFYRYQQKSTNVINPGLTVKVHRKLSDGTIISLQHINVAVMAFTQTGGIDSNTIRIGTTNVNGVYNCSLPAGMQYFIALSTSNMTPTVKDQMMDPYGSFFIELNADTTKQYYLYPRSAANPAYTLTLNITSGIVNGDYVMGEVYINKTGEKTAYGMTRATDTAGVLEIYNLPSAVKGTYGVVVTIPGKNKSYQLFMNSDFPVVSSYSVDMTSAMVFTGGFDASASTTPPSFQGVVRSTWAAPLEGARIEVKQWTDPPCPCYEIARYDTKTDISGKFMFYNIPTSANTYNVTVTKLGYKNQYDGILISTGNITTIVKEYQLEVATYTLTGILKYNGVPIPNADIMLGPDWNSYWNGNDSYTGWGNWMQNDARTKTNADGSFTVIKKLPDGNVRITASFKGGWKELNKGNNENTDSDDIRVVISSQGAVSPNNPPGNPCKPGSTWILNSSGTCVSAGIVNFNIIPENTNTLGKLYGDIVFVTTYSITSSAPLVISTSSPVTIMAIEDCNDCQNRRMGFASVSGSLTNNSISYSLNLSSGTYYWVKLVSNEWGNLSSFNDNADFRSTDTVKFNFKATKSGALKGTVKMPDGSDFRPKWSDNEDDPDAYWADIKVNGVNVQAGDGTELNEFGEFEFPNLAPGIYNIKLEPKGLGFRWPPAMLEGVSVVAGKTSEIKLQIENGLKVQPQIYGLPEISTPTWIYGIVGVNSGEEMNQDTITDLFFEEPRYFFEYSASEGWSSLWMPPGQYDFYLILGSKYKYEPGGDQDEENSYNQFANFMGRVKGMAIKKDEKNPNLGSENQPVQLNILGSIGQTLISGTVKGNKIFTDSDYEKMFVNFQEVIPLLPAIMLYDSAGDLKGFSNAMPDEQAIVGFFNGILAQDKEIIKSTFAARPVRYIVWGLPPGRYTAVFINPNYPPVTKEITLPANETYNFDFDLQNIVVGSISGVVKTSGTLENIENANVYLKHRIVEKFAVTNSSGEFSFSNLPAGIYRLEITKDGFVTAGQKTSLSGNTNSSFSFYMTPSYSKITGKVYTSKFPNSVTKAGIKIVAYDETFNVQYPSAYLPKTEVQTNDMGEYEISGVVPGHVYKISAFYSGKLPEIIETTASDGTSMAGDIVLKDIPPQITIKVRKSPDSANKVDVIIKSPNELISIPTCKYNPGQAFDSDSAVSLALVPGTGNTYLGQFTVTSGQQYYAIKVSAGNAGSQMEKNFIYDQVSNAKTEQFMQDEAIAGGEVQMDKEQEEYTGIELDAGAISYSSGTIDYSDLVGGFFSALPSIRTVKTNKGSMSLESAITGLMASEVYNLDLSNSEPNKPFTLTIKYDKEKAINTNALKIYQYDSESGTWKEVPGNYTVDPMLGIVSVEVASIQNAYTGTGDVTTPLGRKRLGMSAIKNGRYVPSNGSSSQSGQFAVFTAKPGTGTSYTGSAFEIYNMPNPFNLKSKAVVISADGGSAITPGNYSTNGTIIKYHLPSGKTGNVKLVLYNIAGEKVRTLEEGSRTGGYIYYSEWDGKNDKNQNCASGVYFLMTFLNGDKLGNKAHKMAIIK